MNVRKTEPKALPVIPPCEYVYHVVRYVTKLGKGCWKVRTVRYASYELRLRHHGDDGMYFASETVANDVKNVKEKYEKDVQVHVPSYYSNQTAQENENAF